MVGITYVTSSLLLSWDKCPLSCPVHYRLHILPRAHQESNKMSPNTEATK